MAVLAHRLLNRIRDSGMKEEVRKHIFALSAACPFGRNL